METCNPEQQEVDDIEPLDRKVVREILERMDVQAEYEAIGFRPLPGAVPDKYGWLPGESMHVKGGLGFINVGYGPERGLYIEYLPGDFPQRSLSDH